MVMAAHSLIAMSQSVKEHEPEIEETHTRLADALESLEDLDEADVRELEDEELVSLRTTLKELENVTEDVRKDAADSVLRDRVDVGGRLQGLKRVQSHSKYVEDDVGEVVMRAVSEGINYTEFVDLDASTLADEYPELAEIGKHEYDYFV